MVLEEVPALELFGSLGDEKECLTILIKRYINLTIKKRDYIYVRLSQAGNFIISSASYALVVPALKSAL